jgi:SNF2 family DNA or RNA helicase
MKKYTLKSDTLLSEVQRNAISRLIQIYREKKSQGACLALQVGDGKTLVSLLLGNYIRKKTLVVTRSAPIHDWVKEATRRFEPCMKVCDNIHDLSWWNLREFDVVVVSYDLVSIIWKGLINSGIASSTLEDLTPAKIALFNHIWGLIVFDEADDVRNQDTCYFESTTKGLKGEFYLTMTATPFNNQISDLESLFMLSRIGGNPEWGNLLRTNPDMYCQELMRCRDQFMILDDRKQQYHPTTTLVHVPFHHANELVHYDMVQQSKDSKASLPLIMQLRQACDCIYDVTDSNSQIQYSVLGENKVTLAQTVPTKIAALISILRLVEQRNEKALLFVKFKHSIKMIVDHIKRIYPRMTIFITTGETSKEERKKIRNKFASCFRSAILISLDVFRSGVNLQTANHAILYDGWWNPVEQMQQIGRIQRPGQMRSIFIYRIIIQNTIEDIMFMIAVAKSKMAQQILTEEITPKLLEKITMNNAILKLEGFEDKRSLLFTPLFELMTGPTISTMFEQECDIYVSNISEEWISRIPPTRMLQQPETPKRDLLTSSSSSSPLPSSSSSLSPISSPLRPLGIPKPHHLAEEKRRFSILVNTPSPIRTSGKRSLIILKPEDELTSLKMQRN